VTAAPSRPRLSQKLRSNPARSLAFFAPGWRVTGPPPGPKIRAISPPDPPTWPPRLARDTVVRPPSPVSPTRTLIVGRGNDAVAAARRPDGLARVAPGAAAPAAAGAAAGTRLRKPSACAPQTELPGISLGTRCTASNSSLASHAYPPRPAHTTTLPAPAHPARRGRARPRGGSTYVSTPWVNFNERRRQPRRAGRHPELRLRPQPG
jgi:hypothetical protein